MVEQRRLPRRGGRTGAATALMAMLLATGCGGGGGGGSIGFAPLPGGGDTPAGQQVSIHRDALGVPHVRGETAEATLYGAGYAAAQDRLFQLEFLRRLGKGTLAEVLGAEVLPLDRQARTTGYTDAEVRAMLDALPAEYRRLFSAAVQGINAYIAQALQAPQKYLPIEYRLHGLALQPFSEEDAARIHIYTARFYGGAGGQELNNLAFLGEMSARHGAAEARRIFDDIVVLDDPDADTILPGDGAARSRAPATMHKPAPQQPIDPGAAAIGQAWREATLARQRIERSIGLSRGASRSLTIGPGRSADGKVMMLQSTADGVDMHLSGGGFDTAGLVIGFGPPVMGRGPQHGWLITTGESDLVDTMALRLNPADPEQYWFDGGWRRFERREERIAVRGAAPVVHEVRRSVHGPVIEEASTRQQAYALKYAIWGQEMRLWESTIDLGRARSLAQFRAGVRKTVQNYNISYGGEDGHIELWHTGLQPVRAPGVDPRLPTPGDGSAEWRGFVPFEQWPNGANPEAGYFFAWNNKATPASSHGDTARYGKHFRTWLAHDLVGTRTGLTPDDMKDFNCALAEGFGGIDLSATTPAFFAPYLRAAVADDTDPARREAVERMLGWNGRYQDRDGDGRYDDPGLVLFDTWRALALKAIFEDDIGDWAEKLDAPVYVQYRTSLLLRALQGEAAGRPLAYDYFNGEPRNAVIRRTLDATLAALAARFGGSDMSAWKQRGYWRYFDQRAFDGAGPDAPAIGRGPMSLMGSAAVALGLMPAGVPHNGNEDWNALMQIDAAKPPLQSLVPTGGQSRFIDLAGKPSPHLADQVERHRRLDFKSVPLKDSEVRALDAAPTQLRYHP